MFNVDQLRLDIEALIREYPDLAEDEMLRADMLDGQTDIREVLTSLFSTNENTKELIEVLTKRQRNMKARRARLERQVAFLRSLMLKVLQSADLKKMVLPEATLSQRRGQQQIIGEAAVDEDGIVLLPPDLCRVTIEPDRDAIREALLAGRDVPGFALSNAEPILSINDK